MSIEFLLTTLLIVASPGTGVVYTLATGLSRGARAGIFAAFACTIGIVPHLVAALTGLAALLHTSALLFDMVKYAGVAYLLWMAWQVLRQRGAMRIETEAAPRSMAQILVDGIVLNLLNPKLSIFFVAFLPQFIAVNEAAPVLRMLELSALFMAATFIVFAIYGVFAAMMRDQVVGRPAVMIWFRRTFAAAFVALGARLALTER
ncbi:LysE family transporter [Aliihoeflea aestuarii]|jgi:threonine/homoserine/homoserine lactone efflux protein|uniref:LysE family translocator n=1 Tax=Aliihoeflea aestuarii TaxID=453840 RepID=UPI0020961233|nr:LysE family translocator [Aliihoeflea aestuarii]MCO6393090.1 LysE family transporter [Aliihoeflea aestuarii]